MTRRVKVKAAAIGAVAAALHDETHHPSAAEELTQGEIAARAYAFWEARGCVGGSPDDDWYRAVTELEEERQK